MKNSDGNEPKHSRIREYAAGALWNITNFDYQSIAELGEVNHRII